MTRDNGNIIVYVDDKANGSEHIKIFLMKVSLVLFLVQLVANY